MRVVLDTNVLIMSIAKSSPFHTVWTHFLSGHYTICYTNEILLEYEEVLARKVNASFANAILTAIVGAKNTLEIEDYYKMHFDYAVEDSPLAFKFFDHLPDLKVLVFDRPWNQECAFPNQNYIRCFDWKRINELVC